MKFEWNDNKNLRNFEKHGLNFHDAEAIFSGETTTFTDDRYDYGEERLITLGKLKDRVVVIVHTQRSLVTREFFKRQGKGYQTLINAVLKTYVHGQKK